MARKFTQEELDRITELAKNWGKIVVRRGFGDDGPGLDVDLDQMEEMAVAAARGLIAGTLESATEQQAQKLGEQQPCPTCGQLCSVGSAERPVVVRGGAFAHHEPKAHCLACRRDFFPSASPSEAGQPRLLTGHSAQDSDGGRRDQGV